MEGQHPGQTIAPHSEANEPENTSPQPQATPPPPAQWQFQNDAPITSLNVADSEEAPALKHSSSGVDSFSWTASEFVEHSKNLGWYVKLAGATIVLAVLVFLITRGIVSSIVVIVAAIFLAVAAARKPRVLEYRVDDAGLSIGPKLYTYDQFKSFSVIDEGAVPSIHLLPLKRFQPVLTIYFAPTDEDGVVGVLSARLPIEERGIDPIDRFMHRIRF